MNKYIRFGNKNPFFGKHHSIETKQILSEAKKEYYQTHQAYWSGKKRSKETLDKISKKLKGRISPRKGIHLPLVQKIMLSEQRLREKGSRWQGGIRRDRGYIGIISSSHSFGIKSSYKYKHRLIIEECIGRELVRTELVHHINGIRNDNRKDNLMAFNSISAHRRFESNKKVFPEEIIFDGRN
jgi:hypothetical protein